MENMLSSILGLPLFIVVTVIHICLNILYYS